MPVVLIVDCKDTR